MEKVLWKGENVMKFWQSVIFLLHTSLFQAFGLFRCQHLNNRKLDWRETAARNKAFYIFSLIQLHPPGKLGVHSCVVNKIAKWQHDRMIETLIERLKRGAMWEEESKKRCKPRFFFSSSEKLRRCEPILCAQKTELCCSGRTCSRKGVQSKPYQSQHG